MREGEGETGEDDDGGGGRMMMTALIRSVRWHGERTMTGEGFNLAGGMLDRGRRTTIGGALDRGERTTIGGVLDGVRERERDEHRCTFWGKILP